MGVICKCIFVRIKSVSIFMCVCVCVCMGARVCVRVCECVCVRVCVFYWDCISVSTGVGVGTTVGACVVTVMVTCYLSVNLYIQQHNVLVLISPSSLLCLHSSNHTESYRNSFNLFPLLSRNQENSIPEKSQH
jgi:hypothetical protein